MTNEMDNLYNELAKKPKEIIVEKIKTVEVPVNYDAVIANCDAYVFFAQNSAILSEDAMNVLDNIKGTVDIIGFASPEGNATYNKDLSTRRAKVVADYLTKRGVTVNSYKGVGVQGKTSARIAIVTIQ